MNKFSLALAVASISALTSCASEYERVAIPPAEQQNNPLPAAPELHHITWKTLHYQGHQYYALDSKNMSTLNDNLSKMAAYNEAATNDYKTYAITHPVKQTKVIKKKGFWVYANKWWFGCNDKEFLDTPSCKPFQAPDDYVPPIKGNASTAGTDLNAAAPANTNAPTAEPTTPAATSTPSKAS